MLEDFRIGNWIDTITSGRQQIHSITRQKVKDGELDLINGLIPEHIYQIRLTDELVSKINYGEFSFFRITYNKSDEGRHVYWMQDIREGTNFAKQVTTLHQAQNLYFLLTGEELIFSFI